MACAVALHREMGPGPLETVYEAVLARDLEARGLRVARQIPIPIESAVDGHQTRLSTELRRGVDEGRHFPHHKRGN